MATLTIYGASDDLIEVESDSFANEEFNVMLDSPSDSVLLAVSDGTLLRVRYDEDGIWRFTPVRLGSVTGLDINICPPDSEDRYTDIVTLTAETLKWVGLATQVAK